METEYPFLIQAGEIADVIGWVALAFVGIRQKWGWKWFLGAQLIRWVSALLAYLLLIGVVIFGLKSGLVRMHPDSTQLVTTICVVVGQMMAIQGTIIFVNRRRASNERV